MQIIERDVVLQSKDGAGRPTMDFPITRLGNIEDTADTKAVPSAGDYVPVMDSADGGQMKKTPWSAIVALFSAVGHKHTAADVGAVPTTRKVNGKPLSADITLAAADVSARPSTWTPTAADVGAVPTTRKVNGKALSEDITLSASDVGAAAASHGTHVSYSTTAPVMDGTASAGSAAAVARSDHKHPTDTSRAAANHTHTAANVGAVPTTRKVNGKALSSDITLTAADVSARPSTWMPTAEDVGARQMEIVSRVGTGTHGADNPCSITFSFAPKTVMLVGYLQDSHWYEGSNKIVYMPVVPTTYTQHFGFGSTNSKTDYSGATYGKKSTDGKTISWYYIRTSSSGADPVQAQYNQAGATYYFLAIS